MMIQLNAQTLMIQKIPEPLPGIQGTIFNKVELVYMFVISVTEKNVL